MAELKSFELDIGSQSKLEITFESNIGSKSKSKPDKGNNKGKKIIDAKLSATVATIKIHKIEPKDLEEGNASSTHRRG